TPPELVTVGVQQLEAARAANSEHGYELAQDTFSKALAQDPNNPTALVYLGQAQLGRVGVLAMQGKFADSAELTQSAMATMDRAVSLAPDNLDIRFARGSSYGPLPAYLYKADIARDDLEAVARHPQFQTLPKDRRARTFQLLGIVYTNLKDADKAVA